MDSYDNEYRRQYCRERAAQARDEYQRVQSPPKDRRKREPVWMRSVWERVRRQAARVPAYRA